MTILLSLPVIIMTMVSVFAGGGVAQTLDFADVRAIAISGDASSIKITTKADAHYGASTRGRRSSWFAIWYSSWFFNDCRDDSRMYMQGSTLHINAELSSWMDVSDCVLEISANLPAESSVLIDQPALTATFDGHFSRISISGKAADISLEGHATNVNVNGAAVRVHLAYDKVRQDEVVEMEAHSLDAYLGFGQDVPVDHLVTAKASWVDSVDPRVPGAKPSVSIKGEYVRATIR